ncbi:MAG: GNAT family N-acetyltransferase [Candidatus Acidiferrum sp.]
MQFYQLDPTQDPRWVELLAHHSSASAFHSVPWLQALQRTYDYRPVVFTTSPPDSQLKNGMVFCHVKSMLTGHRLVSLPFSDHCEPLFESPRDVHSFALHLQAEQRQKNWKYLEIRPVNVDFAQSDAPAGFAAESSYFLHTLDLRPDLDTLFLGFDKDSVQRRVRRAQQASLVEKSGHSEDLLQEFYRLLVMTRRRHQVPPQPLSWFRNLIQSQGDALEIRVACRDENSVAAILTLRFKDVVYYKYGCSDPSFNKFGATPWLFWNAIVAAKTTGATKFDLGRTEQDNLGLLAFKNHWVPSPHPLVYWRFPASARSFDSAESWKLKAAKQVFSRMPEPLLTVAGRLFYRHLG